MADLYQKIPGIGSGSGSPRLAVRERIYAGPDHLLIVTNTGYSEDYRRIFYRDIRYLVVRKTSGQMIGVLVALALLILFSLIYLAPSLPWAIGAVPSALVVVWLASNVIRGPTCDCRVNTDVQTIRLPAPTRAGKVPRLIAFLEGRVTAAAPVESAASSS
jgi:hypothetical protein